MQVRRFWSVPHVERHGAELALLIALAALLELAAGVGLAYVAGFSQVRTVVGDVRWGWLVVLAGALVVSFAGYLLAYQGIFRVEGGPRLPRRQMYAVVAAGFGGLLAHGWGALDKKALKVAGADEHDAKARASGLAGWSSPCWRSVDAAPRSRSWCLGSARRRPTSPCPGRLSRFPRC